MGKDSAPTRPLRLPWAWIWAPSRTRGRNGSAQPSPSRQPPPRWFGPPRDCHRREPRPRSRPRSGRLPECVGGMARRSPALRANPHRAGLAHPGIATDANPDLGRGPADAHAEGAPPAFHSRQGRTAVCLGDPSALSGRCHPGGHDRNRGLRPGQTAPALSSATRLRHFRPVCTKPASCGFRSPPVNCIGLAFRWRTDAD